MVVRKQTHISEVCMYVRAKFSALFKLIRLRFRTQSAPPVLTMLLKLVCPQWYKLALFIVLSRASQVGQW